LYFLERLLGHMPELSSSPFNSSALDYKKQDQIPPEQPSPIRSVYKTEEELRHLAASVARGEQITLPGYLAFEFDKRLSENDKLILHAYRSADAASRAGETITPAAQWLLDNHY